MNYANSRIYKIVALNGTEEDTYYGSTTQVLHKRFENHRRNYVSWKNGKSPYITSYSIFENHGVEACRIELVETFPCETLEHLRAREGFYIRNNPCVNRKIEGRTDAEYYKDNAENI